MGLLDGILAWADNKRRIGASNVKSLLSGDSDTLNQLIAQTVEDAKAYGQNLHQSAGAFRSVMPGVREASAEQALNGLLNVGGLGAIKVYHGSPHAFTKWEAGKVGTGEGAAAYGYGEGGYHAESPGVAKGYAQKLADGGVIVEPSIPPKVAQSVRDSVRFTAKSDGRANPEAAQEWLDSAIKNLDDVLSRGDGDKIDEALRSYHSRAKEAIANKKFRVLEPNLYEESLRWPDPAREAADPLGPQHFLNWDAPLSEQPRVMDVLRKVGLAEGDRVTGLEMARGPANTVRGEQLIDDLTRQWREDYGVPSLLGVKANNGREAASEFLKQQGIPGIRYLDGGSRGAGQGTSNYVVFDPALVQILKRNGVPVE